MPHLLLPKGKTLAPEFSPAEWRVLEADGLVRPCLPEVWAAAVLPDSSLLRAQSAQLVIPGLLRHRAVVGWRSAAWIHGWASPPPALEVLISQSSRTTSLYRLIHGIVIHEVRDPLDRSLNLGGVFVSDEIRTVLDVARHCSDEDAEVILAAAFADPTLEARLQTYEQLTQAEIPQRLRSRTRTRIKKAVRQAQRNRQPARQPKVSPAGGFR